MYEDRTQNYDPKTHKEYLMHDTPIFLPRRPTSFIATCRLQHSYKHN